MFRFLPSEHRDRLVAGLLAAAVGLGALAPHAFADDLKDKQREASKQVAAANDDLRESSAELRKAMIAWRTAKARLTTAQERLASTQTKLAAAKALDLKMQARLVAAEKALVKAEDELRQGRLEVKVQQAGVDRMFANQYEQFDPRLEGFAALLRAENLADVGRVQQATRAALTEQGGVLLQYREAAALLKVRKEQVADKRDEVEQMRKEAAANLAQMTRLEKQAQLVASRVSKLADSRQSAAATARKLRERDRKALAAAEADQARIERILRDRASKHSSGPVSNGKGYLSNPVNGYVTSPYGYRTHPIYGYRSLHNGIDFGAACGAPLYAAASGTVISKYFQSAWGNRLVIDHGSVRGTGLATIYNHATRYVVSTGQKVKRGQLVGYVGNTGWSTGCHLHFIVMANGTAVNPTNWL